MRLNHERSFLENRRNCSPSELHGRGLFKTFNSYSLNFNGGLRKRRTGCDFFFSYDIFVHGSKCQFIDGINLNLTHVCCEIIFVFTYIALVVFVYKAKQKIIIQ